MNDLDIQNKIIEKHASLCEVYECPSCNNKLKLTYKKLLLVSDYIEDKIEDIDIVKNKIKSLKASVKDINNKIITSKYNNEKKIEIEKELSEIISLYEVWKSVV